jgi:cytochrome c biogenesis protein CcdA
MSQEDPSGYPYQPYGAPYGEQPPPQYGYGYGQPPPRNDGPSANAIVSLVLNLIAIVSCCNFLGIPGAILAGLAIGRARTQPETARTMVIWSWVLFGLGFVLTIGTFVGLGIAGAFDD